MLWFLFLFIFILAGIFSWERILPRRGLLETILIGSLWGMILSSALPFLLALALPFGPAVFVAAALAVTVIVGCGWLGRREWQSKLRHINFASIRGAPALILFLAFLAIVVPYFFLISRILFMNESGGYATGFRSAYGDVPFHLMYITSFAQGGNFPPENPDFAGMRANYPFLSSIVSASVLKLGGNVIVGYLAPLFILSAIIVALLLFVPWRMTGDPWVGVFVALIFLFSGGLGFWWFLQAHGLDILSPEVKLGSGVIDEATNIPGRNVNLMNVMISSLLPQRGFFFGIAVFLTVILLWFDKTPRTILASAFLVGSLPLLHAHTFISIGISLPLFLLLGGRREFWREQWIRFFAVVAVMVLPAVLFFQPAVSQAPGGFIRLTRGWMVQGDNFLWYWMKNLGIFLPLLVISLLVDSGRTRNLRKWYLPFLLIFVVGNLFLFSPWEFDNHKLFNLWYLASSFLVASFLRDMFKHRMRLVKLFAGALLILTILSGAIDVVRLIAFSKPGFLLLDPAAKALGEFLRSNTPAPAVVLDAPDHRSPIVLSGRKRFLGYRGWLFSRGVDYTAREREVAAMYRGGPESEALLRERGITHVLIGREELQNFAVNVAFFEERFEKIYDKDGYKVFRIENLSKP